jgi:cytochrome c peroxidase
MNPFFRAGLVPASKTCAAVCAGLACLALIFGSSRVHAASVMRLQWQPVAGPAPLALHEKFTRPPNGAVALSRLDLLLSGLALQRADGSWLESRGWYAFLSTAGNRLTSSADGIPEEEFRAIRFRVGIDAATNHADPNQHGPESPLNANLNAMHWNWQDGYIFVAVEGRQLEGTTGFSFHLGNDENAVTVAMPVRFRGGGPVTIEFGLDAARLLDGIDFKRDGNSTHSRPGDPIAAKMKANLASVFSVRAVKADMYQDLTTKTAPAAAVAGTTPYRLEISERLPKASLPEDNPLTVQGVELGRRLFHDPRLSINNSQSCASCHQQPAAFSDPRRVSLGAEGQPGRRQSMPLQNLAWAKEFFWDGRVKTLREQALLPIEDPTEMNEKLDRVIAKLEADAEYPALFAAAFGKAAGDSAINAARIGLAIEQFLLTLVSQDSRYDRAARKIETLTEQEKLGLQLFITEHDPRLGLRGADCFHCHGGNLFTNHQFANNGLAPRDGEAGRMEATKLQIDRDLFKAPSLRNVAVTAPYMHDGRFRTLEEVIDHYDHGIHRSPTLDPNIAKHPPEGLGLTAEEKAALVAFLKTLTDDAFLGRASQDITRP